MQVQEPDWWRAVRARRGESHDRFPRLRTVHGSLLRGMLRDGAGGAAMACWSNLPGGPGECGMALLITDLIIWWLKNDVLHWEKTIHDIHCSSGTPWHILLLGCLDVAASRTSNDKHPAKMAGQKFQFGHGISTVKYSKIVRSWKVRLFSPLVQIISLGMGFTKTIGFHCVPLVQNQGILKKPFPKLQVSWLVPSSDCCEVTANYPILPTKCSLYHMNSCSTYIECWRF